MRVRAPLEGPNTGIALPAVLIPSTEEICQYEEDLATEVACRAEWKVV
jgi:hypothetical protein